MRKHYYNKIECWKYINNKYYDVYYHYSFCETHIQLRMLFYLAKNCELSGEINVEMCIIEKSKKIHSKNCKSVFSEAGKKQLTAQFND